RRDAAKALHAFDQAVNVNPADARVAFERDQLLKRTGVPPDERLAQIDPEVAERRDDFTLELCSLYNGTGQPDRALDILRSRQFAPWEGGEGVVLGEWVRAHLILGRRLFDAGKFEEALRHFQEADCPPENLGEARHFLANASDVWFWLGEALNHVGRNRDAERSWKKAAEFRGDFQEMSVRAFSEMTYFQALSLRRLDRRIESDNLLHALLEYALELERTPAKIDYFATSLPTMLLFEDDPQQRQTVTAWFLQAQALIGLGQIEKGRQTLKRVLEADPNHRLAGDFFG
ncbi:MAG: tetratricopeptide repeat protein, partial [Fimbriimonadales bacterium]